jgi:hypothetical protein
MGAIKIGDIETSRKVGERETTDRKEVERGRFGEKKEDGRKERIGGCVRKRK